jgi:hypothetical protein
MVWNNEEDISGLQNGLRTNHYPWKSEHIRSRNEMSWILFHDLGSCYWILMNLNKASRMHQLEESTIPGE